MYGVDEPFEIMLLNNKYILYLFYYLFYIKCINWCKVVNKKKLLLR
jgi:hypothetical protein